MARADNQQACSASVRVGRKSLGAASVLVDADLLTVVLTGGAKKAMRIPLTSIAAIALASDGLNVVLSDGSAVTLDGENVSRIRDVIGGRCRAIPELTRGLRALGSSRRAGLSGAPIKGAIVLEDQRRFFAPLLAARGAAMSARSASDSLAAFDARALRAAIEETLRAFSSARFRAEGPHRRALQAELDDVTESLRAALAELAATANDARTNADDFVQWRRWANQLKATFEIADRAWTDVARALATAPVADTPARGSVAISP